MAQFIDLIVDGRIFFDIGIRSRYISFRLVKIVVGNEIFHCIVREEFLEFTAQLGSQRLVMGDDQGGFLHLLDHLGNGIGLARPRSPQQDLGMESFLHPSGQGIDGFRLVPGRSKGRMDCKWHDVSPLVIDSNPIISYERRLLTGESFFSMER